MVIRSYKFVHTDNRETKRSLKVETSNTLSNMYNRKLPNKKKSLQTLSECSPNTDEHVLQKRREGALFKHSNIRKDSAAKS